MKYLDTNIIGYAIENHAKYGASCKKILEDIEQEKLPVAASLLVLTETMHVLRKINKELSRLRKTPLDIPANITAVLSLPILWLDLNIFIIKRAAENTHPIPSADAVHLATMEINSVYEIISADTDFDTIPFIKRIDPLDY